MTSSSSDIPKVPKVMLSMIVKNESKIINRCLERVRELVDGVCICDTGSTDDTWTILETWKSKIPNVHIFQDGWKNFGHNRTLGIQHALSVIPTEDRNDWFLLFLDADMELVVVEDSKRMEIKNSFLDKADVWYTIQKLGSITYSNIRWVRASMEMECVGPTHEYYEIKTKDPRILTTPEWIYIQDQGDGGCKSDKFSRDVCLLKEDLRKNPTNSRNWFYLANSYRNLNENEEACKAYHHRIGLGGWKEEVYMSLIYLGDTLLRWDDPEHNTQALMAWLEAYEVIPYRVESLYRLCRFYRMQQRPQLAMLFYKQGMKFSSLLSLSSTPTPLFHEHLIEKYLWKIEMSILGFYTGQKEQGKQACLDLLQQEESLPKELFEMTLKNLKYYNFESSTEHINGTYKRNI
uniref:Glycosyltransferase 2-like domain-containing protein n=1 Tax=viral metagenome TaxID=1070528 RepID=A0A6C0D1F4_9ZZZZ